MKRFLRGGFSVAVLSLAVPTYASADPIVVTGGTIVLSRLTAEALTAILDLSGTNGFSFRATGDTSMSDCFCEPGTSVALQGQLFGSFSGTGTLEGTSYRFNVVLGGGVFDINAPSVTLPDDGGTGDVVLDALFALATGTRLTFETSEEDPNPIGVGLTGSGRVTARFSRFNDPEFGTRFITQSITYDFDPDPSAVPEPGSLLLLGGGLAGVWARRRRRARG